MGKNVEYAVTLQVIFTFAGSDNGISLMMLVLEFPVAPIEVYSYPNARDISVIVLWTTKCK